MPGNSRSSCARPLGHPWPAASQHDARHAPRRQPEHDGRERGGIEADPRGVPAVQQPDRERHPDPVRHHHVELAQHLRVVGVLPRDDSGPRVDEGHQPRTLALQRVRDGDLDRVQRLHHVHADPDGRGLAEWA